MCKRSQKTKKKTKNKKQCSTTRNSKVIFLIRLLYFLKHHNTAHPDILNSEIILNKKRIIE